MDEACSSATSGTPFLYHVLLPLVKLPFFAFLQATFVVMRWGLEFIPSARGQASNTSVPPDVHRHHSNTSGPSWESANMSLPHHQQRVSQDFNSNSNKEILTPAQPRSLPFSGLDLRLSSLGAMLTSRIPFPATQYLTSASTSVPSLSDSAFSADSDTTRHQQHTLYDDRFSTQYEAQEFDPQPLSNLPNAHIDLGPPLLYTDCHVNPVALTSANLLSHAGISVDSNDIGCFNSNSQEISLEASVASTPNYYSADPAESIISSQYVTPYTTRDQSTEPGPSSVPMVLPRLAIPSRSGSFSSLDIATGGVSSSIASSSNNGDLAMPSTRASSIQASSLGEMDRATIDEDKAKGTLETKEASRPLSMIPFKRKGYSFCNVDKSRLLFRYSNRIVIPALEKNDAIPYSTKTPHDFRHDPTSEEFLAASKAEDEIIVAQASKLGAGDMYTPRFVKTTLAGRFGWCDCGEWLGMKSSVYNYHMTMHGISCRSGQPFTPPEQMRWCTEERIVDAYCGHCNEWVNLLRKMMRHMSWKNWFLHASHCHHKDVRKKPVTKLNLKAEEDDGSGFVPPAKRVKKA